MRMLACTRRCKRRDKMAAASSLVGWVAAHLASAPHIAIGWLPYTAAHCLIGLNFVFRSLLPGAMQFRSAYMLISSLVLVGGPWLIPLSCRSMSVQLAGALVAAWMRACEYAFFIKMPEDYVSSPYRILVHAIKDTFLPFGDSSRPAERREPAVVTERPSGAAPSSGSSDSARRQKPLAAPGESAWATRLLLLQQVPIQYLIYDLALSVAVKARGVAADPLHPSAWRVTAVGLVQSCGFAVALYLHFAIWHKILVVALSLVMPELLTLLCHQFSSP
jgi:hypothetical protein